LEPPVRQGGGLVRAIQTDADSGFRARAITRDLQSETALVLTALAFAGARQGRSEARDLLEDTPMGKYKVPHFDAKGEADRHFTAPGAPTTLLLMSFYWDNFIYFGSGPQKTPDGGLAVTFPMGDERLPGIAAEDIGKCAYGIFQRGGEYIGKRAGGHLTGSEMAAALSRALGRDISYNNLPRGIYRGFGFPGADDLGNMFQFKRDFNEMFCGARDPAVAWNLNPELLTFHAWLAKNARRIPLPS
jgi:hypothetical protein